MRKQIGCFLLVLLGTTLSDGLITGAYFAVVNHNAVYFIVRVLYAFFFDIWYILVAGILFEGIRTGLFGYTNKLGGQMLGGSLLGGFAGAIALPNIGIHRLTESLLFAGVGLTWGLLHWFIITSPTLTRDKRS